MSLELKSIHELRGIAQAVGVKIDWSWEKHRLIQKIEEKTMPPPLPTPTVTAIPHGAGQVAIVELLKQFPGVIATFPDEDTWQINYGRKQDSGSITVPIKIIVQCAENLVNG